jgi:hypothetical protein
MMDRRFTIATNRRDFPSSLFYGFLGRQAASRYDALRLAKITEFPSN